MSKAKTLKQRYREKVGWLRFGSYAPFPLALGTLTAFRFKEWFNVSDSGASAVTTRVQIGIGFVLALVIFVLIVLKKSSYLKGIWGWVLALGITYCLRTIINELWLILIAMTAAEIVCELLKSPLEDAERQYALVRDTVTQEKVKREIADEYSGRV